MVWLTCRIAEAVVDLAVGKQTSSESESEYCGLVIHYIYNDKEGARAYVEELELKS